MRKSPLERMREISETLGVPYAVDLYEGPADEFVVYSILNISGRQFGDNRAVQQVAECELHYIQPVRASYYEKLTEIQDLLVRHGFSFPVVTIDKDEKFRILKFSTECIF